MSHSARRHPAGRERSRRLCKNLGRHAAAGEAVGSTHRTQFQFQAQRLGHRAEIRYFHVPALLDVAIRGLVRHASTLGEGVPSQSLEVEAPTCYNRITQSGLDSASISELQDVFVNWLLKRLAHLSAKEIEEMLLGSLPDIRQTKAGQELIAIGIEQGLEQGIEQGIEKGIEKGLEKGLEQGIEKGIEQGRGEGWFIGQIQLYETLLGVSTPASDGELNEFSLEQLQSRWTQLRQEFQSRR